MPPSIESDWESAKKAISSILLEQVQRRSHIPSPCAGLAVHQLPQERLDDRSESEQSLAHEVELTAATRYCRQRAGGVLWERARAGVRMPRMKFVGSVRHDRLLFPGEELRGLDPQRLRRYRNVPIISRRFVLKLLRANTGLKVEVIASGQIPVGTPSDAVKLSWPRSRGTSA